MKSIYTSKPRRLCTTLEWFGWTILFALAYSQAPLFTSNQNQYFLHGAAHAGVGLLQKDWLANTLDPTPLFSLLVEFVFRYLQPEFFYLVYAILLGIYILCLRSIGQHFLKHKYGNTGQLVYMSLLIMLHSAGVRAIMSFVPGPYWKYFFEAGVAGQRALGTVLQPSTFSVFLVLAIALYLARKEYTAILSAVLACSFHPTYLPSAAMLVFAMLIQTSLDEKSFKTPLRMSVLALLLVLPITSYVFISFQNAPPDLVRQSQEILVQYRIPHHALIGEWFDITVILKTILLSLAILSIRKSRLFYLMLIPSITMLILTGIVALSNNNQLALLFPWRMSVWLYPLAIAILMVKVLNAIPFPHDKRWPVFAGIGLTAVLSLFGGILFTYQLEQKKLAAEQSLTQYVRDNKQPGDIYMIPHKLQTFRLLSGAPALVEGKAIPYAASEVLEWYQRHRFTTWFYRDSLDQIDCNLLDTARDEYQVTHVVLSAAQFGLDCAGMQLIYQDEFYAMLVLVP